MEDGLDGLPPSSSPRALGIESFLPISTMDAAPGPLPARRTHTPVAAVSPRLLHRGRTPTSSTPRRTRTMRGPTMTSPVGPPRGESPDDADVTNDDDKDENDDEGFGLSFGRRVTVVLRIAVAPGALQADNHDCSDNDHNLTHDNDNDDHTTQTHHTTHDNDDHLCIFPMVAEEAQTTSVSAAPTDYRQQDWRRLLRLAPRDSPQDILLVNPTAFGTHIPNHVTMETATLVQAVAHMDTTTTTTAVEDWVRRFHCHHVLWPHTGANRPTDTDALPRLATAMAQDVTRPGSIAHRTVLLQGCHLPKLLFGAVASSSVAQVLAMPRVDPGHDKKDKEDTTNMILNYYGLLGLVAHKLLALTTNPTQTGSDRHVVTMSILEIHNDQDLYDLLSAKPFDPKNKVQLRHAANRNNGTQGSSPSRLLGLADVMVTDVKQVGRCVRRALAAAHHKRRTAPCGHILATLKVWNNNNNNNNNNNHVPGAPAGMSKYTVAQFLQVAPTRPHDGSATATMVRHNAAVRQSLTALGGVLRGALLKEAGNDSSAVSSFRDSMLTQVLQRSIEHVDGRVVVLANISPWAKDYEETLATCRYTSRLLFPAGHVMMHSPLFIGSKKHRTTQAKSEQQQESLVSGSDGAVIGLENNATMQVTSPDGLGSEASTTNLVHLTQYAEQATLLQNLLSDPRQRLAKLLKPSRRKVVDELPVTEVTNSHVPASYDISMSDEYRDEEEHDNPASYELPTPLVRNTGPVGAPSGRELESAPMIGPERRKQEDFGNSSLSLDAMEEGRDSFVYDEPSPLTTDTSFSFSQQHDKMLDAIIELDDTGNQPLVAEKRGETRIGKTFPDYEDEPASGGFLLGWNNEQADKTAADEQAMIDLSLELLEKTRGGVEHILAGDRSYSQEMEDLERELMVRTNPLVVVDEIDQRKVEDLENFENRKHLYGNSDRDRQGATSPDKDDSRESLKQSRHGQSTSSTQDLVLQRDDPVQESAGVNTSVDSYIENESELQDYIAKLMNERDTAIVSMRRAQLQLEEELERQSTEREVRDRETSQLVDVAHHLRSQLDQAELTSATSLNETRDLAEKQLTKVAQEAVRASDLLTSEISEQKETIQRLQSVIQERDKDELDMRSLSEKYRTELGRKEEEILRMQTEIQKLNSATPAMNGSDKLAESNHELLMKVEHYRSLVDAKETELQRLRNVVNEMYTNNQQLELETLDARREYEARNDAERAHDELQTECDQAKRELENRDAQIRELEIALNDTRAYIEAIHRERSSEQDELMHYQRELREKDLELQGTRTALEEVKTTLTKAYSEEKASFLADQATARREVAEAQVALEQLQRLHADYQRQNDEETAQLKLMLEMQEEKSKGEQDSTIKQLLAERDILKHEVENLKLSLQNSNQVHETLQGNLKAHEAQNIDLERKLSEILANATNTQAEHDREKMEMRLEIEHCQVELQLVTKTLSEVKLDAEQKVAEGRMALDKLEGVVHDHELKAIEYQRLVERLENEKMELELAVSQTREESETSLKKALEEALSELEQAEKSAAKNAIDFHQQVERLRREIDSKDEAISDLRSAIENSKRESDEREKEIMDARDRAEKRALDTERLLDEEKRALHQAELQIVEMQSGLDKSKADRAEALKIADEAEGMLAELEKRVAQLEEELTSNMAASDELEAENDRLNAELTERQIEAESLRDELASARKELRTSKQQLTRFDSEKAQIEAEVAQLREKLRRSEDLADEVEELRETKAFQTHEINALQEAITAAQADTQSRLSVSDSEIRRLRDECDRLLTELSEARALQSSDASAHSQELAQMRENFDDLQSRYTTLEEDLILATDAKNVLSLELEQTQADLTLRIADIKELSTSLKTLLEEKEQADAQLLTMKEAVTKFQDEMRSKVQKVVHQRSEAAKLLEKALGEKEHLEEVTDGLETELRETHQRLADLESQVESHRNDVTRAWDQYHAAMDENRGLRASLEEMEAKCHRLERMPDSEVAPGVHARRVSTSFEKSWNETDRSHGVVPSERRTASARKRGFDRPVDPGFEPFSTPPRSHYRVGEKDWFPTDGPDSYGDFASRADEIAAYIALSAKKAVERRNVELVHLKRQLASVTEDGPRTDMARLRRRVAALERQLVDRPLAPDDADVDASTHQELAELEALKRRVRSLEQKLEVERPGALSSVGKDRLP